jgi:hypothetical protein
MKPINLIATFIIVALISGCCRNDCANTYIIEGVVIELATGLPCVGFEVVMEEQVLENGVLNGFFETAGTANTDEAGFFTISFPRKSALEYRIGIDEEGWFGISEDINPDDFSPDIPVHIDMEAVPKAELSVNIINQIPSAELDKLRFRFLEDFEHYTTCGTDWRVFEGASVDTTINCILPGNVWMPYLHIDQSGEEDVEVSDSIYCVAFETTSLEIPF